MNHLNIDLAGHVIGSRPPRLLVVDDDPFIRDLHATALRMNGYIVATAADGVHALEQLADEPFDLLLTDQQMPGIDGASVVLALRSAGSRMPVIMVSGSLAAAPLPSAIAREIFAAIPKPVRTTEVLSAVARALRPARAGTREYFFLGVANLAA
jgi:CheY-like chemotaxis protein